MDMKSITQSCKELKLLYVEDEDDIREATAELLNNFFTTIVTAVDGQDGLNKYNQNDFDIIISDINMPNLSGVEMANAIREKDKDISILFLTAHNESSCLFDGIRIGVDGYILKPVDLDQLVATLAKAVEKISLKKRSEDYKEYLEKEVKSRTAEIEHKLYFDELTGAYSRYSFFHDIKKVEDGLVLIVDINKFKVINEIYGTSVGNTVLKEFAKYLIDFTDNNNKVYRLSGDEFVIVYDKGQQHRNIISKLFKLLDDFRVDLVDDSISIEVTIGVSTCKEDIYESAKVALDFAKINHKPYSEYSIEIDKREEEKTAIEWKNKIKAAISEDRIKAVYHPIVNQDGEIVKHETLMRIKDDKTDKLISPFFFLEVSIKTGLYDALSEYVILGSLSKLETSEHTLSINFTYADIKNSKLINDIEEFFQRNSELGARAVFEITESESIANYDDVKDFIKRFKQYGVRIAIDDFGSGFSNFEYILEIEPDYLKIDGSLVKNIDTDEKSHILVKAIVQFSQELGIKVIAEFVHSETVFNMLKELHVDEYQGFYFSEPLENI